MTSTNQPKVSQPTNHIDPKEEKGLINSIVQVCTVADWLVERQEQSLRHDNLFRNETEAEGCVDSSGSVTQNKNIKGHHFPLSWHLSSVWLVCEKEA